MRVSILRVLFKTPRFKDSVLEGRTPLNNPPIEKHVKNTKSKWGFRPFCRRFSVLRSYQCYPQRWNFILILIFCYVISRNFSVRAPEQRPLYFLQSRWAPHHFRPIYHSDVICPMHVRFRIYPGYILNIQTLIYLYYKNKQQSFLSSSFCTPLYFMIGPIFTGTF